MAAGRGRKAALHRSRGPGHQERVCSLGLFTGTLPPQQGSESRADLPAFLAPRPRTDHQGG